MQNVLCNILLLAANLCGDKLTSEIDINTSASIARNNGRNNINKR